MIIQQIVHITYQKLQRLASLFKSFADNIYDRFVSSKQYLLDFFECLMMSDSFSYSTFRLIVCNSQRVA